MLLLVIITYGWRKAFSREAYNNVRNSNAIRVMHIIHIFVAIIACVIIYFL